MIRTAWVAAVACLTAAASLAPLAAQAAQAPLRRIALVAGANRATPDRIPLRYAVADAERFANVVMHLGGVASRDCLTLREPTREAFLSALDSLRARVAEAQQVADRVEVLVYYSGHADEKGLLLGHRLLAYAELRQALAGLSADVAIAVLDACASGAITRIKGGQTHPAFLTDLSSSTSGYAFLTSSSENEAAQESERIGGSYFTHALVSGLRGAADTSGDGRVTLGEAYQFAFQETLAQTAPTEAGAQHPSYDMKMSGTGDVVMTDVRQTACSLVLAPDLDGRFFVRNSRRQLVAELYKPAGRSVELALEPGTYEVHFDQPQRYLRSRLTLAEGQRRVLAREELRPRRRLATSRRGGGGGIVDLPRSGPVAGLDGTTRVEMQLGFSNTGVRTAASGEEVRFRGGQFMISGTHWLRENLALELSMRASDFEVRTGALEPEPILQPAGASAGSGTTGLGTGDSVEETRTEGAFGLLCGVRYYFPGLDGNVPLRPYVTAALGPHTDVRVHAIQDQDTDVSSGTTRPGAYVGGGIDFLIKRRFVLGAYTGTTLRRGKERRIGFGLTLGVAFGGASEPIL